MTPARSLSLSRSAARREFRARLLAWFAAHARDLPWRRTRDPYAIWVSEVMLQQTRVAAVIERYNMFMARLPTVRALAEASEAEVLALWSGLGYYRRARMMHRAGRVVVERVGGRVPESAAELLGLPGIGRYTSAAIASIAFGEAVAVVDGNVERVVMRLMCWQEDGTAAAAQQTRIQQQATALLDTARPGDFNQAMMELGATICLPRGPLCLQCPVFDYCLTRGEHATRPRAKMRSEEIAYGLLRRGEGASAQVLLEQRPVGGTVMAGMWELPLIDAGVGDKEKAVLRVRHAIMKTNYFATILEIAEEELDLQSPRAAVRKWFSRSDVAGVALTGLARKVLIRVGCFSGVGPV